MKLTFNTTYLSIRQFPEIELPKFTLITGPNGVGKSHLLQAIVAGAVKADCVPNHSPRDESQIRLFDWNDIVPKDESPFTNENLDREKNHLSKIYKESFGVLDTNLFQDLQNFAQKYNLPQKYHQKISAIPKITPQELRELGIDETNIQDVETELQEITKKAEDIILSKFSPEARQQLSKTAQEFKKYVFELSESEILSPKIPNWGNAEFFQHSFGRLFVSYRNLYLENLLAELKRNKGYTDIKEMSDLEFIQKNGPKPWEFVNQSLAEAGLDFKINKPEIYEFATYHPTLRKITSGAEINFQSLSSGEKVLMSLAFCIYYSQEDRQLTTYPKLLLLDEIDAPLHPSMSRSLIKIIQNTLVEKYGISVIATTHSPSTVALAPEDSIYVMRSGLPGIHKTSKNEALNLLTDGVPTLSLSFDGRRQVFVESPADAETYEKIYKILEPRLASERSLQFIAVGTKNESGQDINNGCDAVKRIVDELVATGNTSVFGLLDWDGKNEPSKRMAILAHNRRNAIENVLFDPLLIAALIFRTPARNESFLEDFGDLNYPGFLTSQPSIQQKAVDKVTEFVLGSSAEEKVEVQYLSGETMLVDKQYLIMDDHELEDILKEKFTFLTTDARRAGQLLQHIIDTVLRDKIDFTPVEIFDVFSELLNKDLHL